ncbi:hypothetical protein F4861DRAFT_546731 [Xylaria intraflava]|nr:hypothetical protein F4861DRAFT_546731 [Xylaria intraflava]
MTRKRACDVCYRRKILCSISNPRQPCEWCNEHELSCTFTRESQRKARSKLRLSDVEGLFRRVEQLESTLAQSRVNDRPSQAQAESPTSPASDIEVDLLQSDFSPAQYWYCRGIPLLTDRGQKWIYSKTDQYLITDQFQSFDGQSNLELSARPPPSSDHEFWALPPKGAVQKLVAIFFKSSVQLVFPVFDSVLFEATIETAYSRTNSIPSPLQALSVACILAALSIFCRLAGSKSVLPGADGDTYAAKAQRLLGFVTEETSLVGLQTILLLQRHQMSMGNSQSATLLHAVACRMVCALGGHTYRSLGPYRHEISWEAHKEHHTRMLFWLCYISDKDISLRLAQPPLLTEEYCDLTTPESCTSYCAQLPAVEKAVTCEKFNIHIPGDPILCSLKEKIYRLLYAPQAYKISDESIVLRIRQLDDDLESWRISIPPELRPKLLISPNQTVLTSEHNSTRDIRGINLQLEYHHLVTAIHTSVRRCGANSPEHQDLPDDLHNVIHSSCDLSLEGSRSTLMLLSTTISLLPEAEFSRFIFYPTLAVLSLFIDILAHPHGAQSHTAVDDLLSAINIIRGLPGPTPTQSELGQTQETAGFITELVRLGRCAIAKAEQNPR